MVRAVAAILVVLALGAQVNAQYGGTRAQSAVETKGRLNQAGDKFYVTSATGQELKGVWQLDGLEAPRSQIVAEEDSALPDCSNDGTLPSYVGLDFDAPRFTVIAGPTNVTNLMNVNQQRSTFSANATYSYPFIVTTAASGVSTCTHLQPYVDVGTGDLMAESLTISVWSRNTTQGATAPIRTRPTCELTGRERVGCYTEQVALSSEIARAPASAPTVSISSIPGVAPAAARPEGSVVTIARNTLRCRQGECLRLSPKHSTTSPAYAG